METQKGPIKTTVLLKGGYMGLHLSLGECRIRDQKRHLPSLAQLGRSWIGCSAGLDLAKFIPGRVEGNPVVCSLKAQGPILEFQGFCVRKVR